MKIVAVEPVIVRIPALDDPCPWGWDAFLVRVVTDEGLVGLGASDTSPFVAKAVIEAPQSNFISTGLRKVLLGEDPLAIQRLWDAMYVASTYFGRKGPALHAMSAVDIALWDIASQFYGVPIHTLLGGKQHNRIRCYATLDAAALDLDDGLGRARGLVDSGFTAIKLGIGSGPIEEEYERVSAYRDVVGPDVELSVDVCSQWQTYGQASAGVRRFDDLGLSFIEEPVHADDHVSYAKLAEQTSARIAGGENLTGRHEFATFIEKARPDIVQPDITRCGGISELRRIYDIATANGCEVVPHDWSTGILIAATVQFLAAQSPSPFFEYCISDSPIFTEMITNTPACVDGYVDVPDVIGLGVDLDEDFVATYEVTGWPG